ncbi:MAG: substrate-binding domain-containing protein [Bacteroides sp.]|nr:substrate-binding domain-containing protein [Bacteroides sp.]
MENKVPKVGLVMKSLQADFFKVMQQGAESFVNESRCCELLSVGTDSQTEIDKQVSLVESLIDEGVDAMVVVPIDSKALVAPVVKAVKSGVCVVNIDIKLDSKLLEEVGVAVDFVGPDNYTASYSVGSRLASAVDKGDKVIVIEGLPVADNARQRKAGFDRVITEKGLDCVASVPANWETATAEEVFSKLYKEHPDVKAVFCCNDAMALGVINVLKAAGRKPGEIKIAGFDNDAVMKPLLDEGWLLATADAYASRMGVEGIKHALHLLSEGKSSEGDKPTPVRIIG